MKDQKSDNFSENQNLDFNKYQELLSRFFEQAQEEFQNINLDPFNMAETFSKTYKDLLEHPEKLMESQLDLAKKQIELFNQISNEAMGEGPIAASTKDSRFKDETWDKHPAFKYLKESYLLNSKWLMGLAQDVDSLNEHEHHKLEFFTKFLTDSVSPTNFALTNPEVIRETLMSEGKNIFRGVDHFLEDLKAHKISTTAFDAFGVGKNLATTEGSVVFQNKLMQLIQYKPLTEQVFEIPVIVMPAWINKYYILDLQEKNSFVRWLVEQGYTVFMISWKNPDKSLKDSDFADYMKLGPLSAIEEVKKLAGVSQVNFIGYCLGGTLLACTLAYLKAKKPTETPIKTASFLTTLVDFDEAGDLTVFIDEEQIAALEKRMDEKGYLEGDEMAQTFSMIRANDMIWSFYINNYLLGKDPFPFDILYWNSDSTRLPAKMHSFYLRQMYQQNNLVKGKVKLDGVKIDLNTIDLPVYMLSTKEDHIAPWKSTYKARQFYKGPIRFTLSASGHVAGVTNHPGRNKYCYWTAPKVPATPDEFLKIASETAGSWWIDWNQWASTLSGEKVSARKIGKALESAPGSYVLEKV